MSAGRAPRRQRRLALVAVLIALIIGCRPGPMPVSLDLTAEWSKALVATETPAIDLGTPSARSFLGTGWYYDEVNRTTGETFAWSRGRESELRFHLGWRRDLTIEIRCRPFEFPGATPQVMNLGLNGRPIAEITLEPGMSVIRAVLPAGDQVEGRNRLVARYRRVDSPAATVAGATDERELAVAWDWIRFDGVSDGAVRVSASAVELPLGAQTDHFVEAPGGSVLEVDRCEPLGGAAAEIAVEVLADGSETPETTLALCDGGPVRVHLYDSKILQRIRLHVLPATGFGISNGVRLVGPVIRGPEPEPMPVVEEAVEVAPGSERPNVVIYLVDALRADRLGTYGCERPLSPNLDAMAAEGVVFADTVAQSSWTKASVASIFTGLWPREHGVNGPDDCLPEGLSTLPERFHEAGYHTAAIVANAYVGRPFGFARGFDHFEFIEHVRGRSEVLHERIVAWMNSLPVDGKPFFLYVHTIDPHAPYAPPPPFLERFAGTVDDPTVGEVATVRGLVLGTVTPSEALTRDLRDLYDAEVAANDASFGQLIRELRGHGELEHSVVVFTSDHGEAFGEHGSFTHGLDLYREVLAIPLVIRLPGARGAGLRVNTTVQHIDLPPTLLTLAGLPGSNELPGRVLVDDRGSARGGPPRTVLSYLDYWGHRGAVAIRGDWKVIVPLTADFGRDVELYRRPDDPGETRNLAPEMPVRLGWLQGPLEAALRVKGISERIRVDPETREQLQALGYLE